MVDEAVNGNGFLPSSIKKRNCCLFLFEILACVTIIFIHTGFPGRLGSLLVYFARFGVPLFFMVSGYYMISDDVQDSRQLKKRMIIKILKLLLLLFISLITYFCLALYLNRSDLSQFFVSRFNIKRLLFFLLFNLPFLSVHNWFLLALIYVYLIVMLFPKLFIGKNIWLYIMSSILIITLGLHILSYQTDLTFFGEKIYNLMFFRNWFFNALPFVTLGLVIKRKMDVLSKVNTAFLLALIVVSSFLMVIEIYAYAKFLKAGVEFCLFNVVFCSSILVLSYKKPLYSLEKVRMLRTKGNWTTFVYIFHPVFITVVSALFSKLGLNQYAITPYIKPLLVIIFSVLFALVFNYFYYPIEGKVFKKLRK